MKNEVESFFQKDDKWKDEYGKLREIILNSGLREEYKWMHPCYTLKGKNVVLIHGFKEYCAILFFKGALMEDHQGLLIQQTENVQSQRQIRFTSVTDIERNAKTVGEYIQQAIEIEKSGKKIELKKTNEYEVPVEFQEKLDNDPKLRNSFEALTPGRQRAYLFYFSTAKKSETRESRIEKYLSRIMEGKGIDDE